MQVVVLLVTGAMLLPVVLAWGFVRMGRYIEANLPRLAEAEATRREREAARVALGGPAYKALIVAQSVLYAAVMLSNMWINLPPSIGARVPKPRVMYPIWAAIWLGLLGVYLAVLIVRRRLDARLAAAGPDGAVQ